MKKITKMFLTLALLVVGVGEMSAGKYHASLSTDWYINAQWNSGTNTMSWTGTWNQPSGGWGSYYFLNTGLPSGDITSYTKFHATLSNFSDNVDHIWLRIKQGDDNYADAKLVAGENNIDLKALATANPSVDFTKVTDITLWGAREALDGKTIDGENPASVVVTNVYLQTVKNITNGVLVDEITDMSYLTEGNRFVIANSNDTQIQTYPGNDPGTSATSLKGVTADMYYYFTIEELPVLDIDEDGNADEATYYRIAIQNAAGTAKPSGWWGDNYVNIMHEWGGVIWSTTCDAEKENGYGRMGKFNAVWTVEYEEGKGFKIYNPKNHKYLTVSGASDGETYLKLYQSLDLKINTEFDKEDNEADDAIFAFANATGYDAETGTLTNGGWTFDTPVDLSNWDYLVITTTDNASNGSIVIRITDNDGVAVAGNGYSGAEAGTVKDLYLDRWNNQNAVRISIDYLRATKGMDISKIKSLSFSNLSGGDCSFRISNVYLTDYNNTKIAGGYCEGDVKREYTETGKFGTICLPYKASYAGAEVYSISGKHNNYLYLEKVTGLLEAGKPYFYQSADANGQDNAAAVRNVNFFRADLGNYDTDEAGTNNGLIGTFETIEAPQRSNYYVLSNNNLYDTEGSTVTVGANKAYIDLEQVPAAAADAKSLVKLYFDESSAIETVEEAKTLNGGQIYDLSGRSVRHMTRGLYIVNGKKVLIK